MKLLSIFVGRPQKVTFKGNEVETGIFKEKIEGSVKVKTLNIEGDEQADLRVHGGVNKAVYAYPFQHYKFWENERPDLSFEAGKFGENLSIEGLDEKTVFVGNEYKIGSVIFKVTAPRMPCHKLGIKMEDPRFVKDFMQARLSGFYFSVKQEGIIEAGNSIELLKEGENELTIDETFLAYHSERNNKQLLHKTISTPDLPEDWIEFFKKRYDALA